MLLGHKYLLSSYNIHCNDLYCVVFGFDKSSADDIVDMTCVIPSILCVGVKPHTPVGAPDGMWDVLGANDSMYDGLAVGDNEGETLGFMLVDGICVGVSVGFEDKLGDLDGWVVGVPVGVILGIVLGIEEGFLVGLFVGYFVGLRVGLNVGALVGLQVLRTTYG